MLIPTLRVVIKTRKDIQKKWRKYSLAHLMSTVQQTYDITELKLMPIASTSHLTLISSTQ